MNRGGRPGDWYCTNCKFTIFASKASCIRCGQLRTHGQPQQPHQPPSSTSTSTRVAHQPDWNCPQCGELVFGSKPCCRKCGSTNPANSGAAASATPAPAPSGAPISAQQQGWWCAACQNMAAGAACDGCGARAPHASPSTAPAATAARPQQRTPDFDCPNCKYVIFGSKDKCGKCGYRNPHLVAASLGTAAAAAASATTAAAPPLPTSFVEGAPTRGNSIVSGSPATRPPRLPDWTCHACGDTVFGSRPACRKCGASNPALKIHVERVLAGERDRTHALVEELTAQVAVASAALGSVRGSGSGDVTNTVTATSTATATSSSSPATTPADLAAATAKLEQLLAAVTSAKDRFATAERAAAAGPSTIDVKPPPYWIIGPGHVFPSHGVSKVDITLQSIDGDDDDTTTTNNTVYGSVPYIAAVQSFIDASCRRACGTGGDAIAPYAVRTVWRLQNDRLWVYYASNRSLMRPATGLLTPPAVTSTMPVSDAEAAADPLRAFLTSAQCGLNRGVNECFLFHGTSPQAVTIICEQGFDERVCSLHGNYGAGVYFAEKASKALAYVTRDAATKCGYVFISRVCLGNVHKYEASTDSNLRRAPRDSDAVVGTPSKSAAREFIVYDRRQTFPEYLIELQF